MNWYADMNEQEKRSFQKVIVVCIAGGILIRLVPVFFDIFF